MRKTKKALAAVLAGLMVLSFAGCGSKEAKTITKKADLEGATIGVQLGTTGDLYVEDEVKDAKVQQYSKGADAVQALKQGKVDAVIIDEQPAKAFVNQNDELKILDEALTEEDYAVCIAKDKTELKEKINDALKTLKSNGTLQAIIDNYIGDDTKGENPYKAADIERPNGTLVMATNAAFEPYEYYEDKKIVGIDVDMMQAVCDILGMELKVEDMEFDAIINAVQSGKADVGAAGMTVNEERLLSIDFTDTYTTSTQVIIVKK